MNDKNPHIPVMLNEVLENLRLKDFATYIDGTFGNGGYSKAILDSADNVKLIAFDRDKNVLPRVEEFKRLYGERFIFFNEKFSNVLPVLEENNLVAQGVDGLVLDIGVSSMQIDNADRGFSFRFDSELSMAMGKNDIDAKDVVNNYDEKTLSDIFFVYGEEHKSKIIAKKIVRTRTEKPIETTGQLVNIIKDSVGEFYATKAIPRIFQAIRIYVNNELGELSKILEDSEKILCHGGRLVVVDFHSLEDRIVKRFIQNKTKSKEENSRYLPCNKNRFYEKLSFKVVQKNAILPTEDEVKMNPRSRSAKLRVVEKL